VKAIRVIWLPGSITAEQRYHAAKALFESGLADWETARRAASRTPGILAASDDLGKIDEIVRRLREVEIYPQVTERDESVETRQPPASHPEVSLSEPLPERLEGRRGPIPNVQAANDRESAEAAARSAHDVVARVDAAFAGLVGVVEALPAERPLHFMAVRLIAVESYGHFFEHEPELDAALPTTREALLARLDESWALFRGAIRERGRAGLMDATPSGWSYRDLCAHAANWMQHAVREIESGEIAKWDRGTILAENDRAVAAHRLVGPEAMLGELDASFARLRDVVGSLHEERLADDRIRAVIGYYSYLHWEDEHGGELALPL